MATLLGHAERSPPSGHMARCWHPWIKVLVMLVQACNLEGLHRLLRCQQLCFLTIWLLHHLGGVQGLAGLKFHAYPDVMAP